MLIKRKSILTGLEAELDLPITEEQITRWENGELAQFAFSNLTPSQRDFFLLGVTEKEWQEIIGENDEEDSDQSQ